MTYILDLDGDYIKKCKTWDCPNVVFIGFSRTLCRDCLGEEVERLELKIAPYFEQRLLM